MHHLSYLIKLIGTYSYRDADPIDAGIARVQAASKGNYFIILSLSKGM